MEQREGFKGPLSSVRASAILTLKGESIAVKMSSLSRVEEALKAFGEGRILGHYPGRAITRVGDLSIFLRSFFI
jgi:hypothetical protein